jgi:hypothetical protein
MISMAWCLDVVVVVGRLKCDHQSEASKTCEKPSIAPASLTYATSDVDAKKSSNGWNSCNATLSIIQNLHAKISSA